MNINKMLLSKNKYSRPGIYMDKIKGIVIHYVGNPNTSAEANRNYFENLKYGTNNIYASSHYIIGIDGEIIMCVPEGEVAYHASKANYEYIGIECCHKYSDGKFSHKTINSLVMLCKDIISRYGNMDIIRHYDVTGKNCPLYYVKNTDEWTITKIAGTENMVVRIHNSCSLFTNSVDGASAIRPAFFLNFNVQYGSGTGTQTDPYRIV